LEKFSENPGPKRKRGRPRKFSQVFEQAADAVGLLEKTQTARTHHNRKHFMEALGVLRHAPNPERFFYLISDDKHIATGAKMRLSILVELGHLDRQDLIEWAEVICRERLPTLEAVRRVRAWRQGRDVFPAADKAGLLEDLIQALERYWGTHSQPDDTGMLEMTRDVLDTLKVMYQEKVASGEAD
jgi:hypothetical protein